MKIIRSKDFNGNIEVTYLVENITTYSEMKGVGRNEQIDIVEDITGNQDRLQSSGEERRA